MTTPESTDLDLTESSIYTHWTHEVLRFSDTDAMGHINNGAYAGCFETARIKMVLGLAEEIEALGAGWVLARICIDYRAQLFYPGEVDVGSRVTAIGRSSFTLAQGLFRDGVCCGTATGVLVLIDIPSGKSTPIPQAMRERIALK